MSVRSRNNIQLPKSVSLFFSAIIYLQFFSEALSHTNLGYSKSEFRTAQEIGTSAFFQTSGLVTPAFRGQIQQLVQAAEVEMNDVQAQVPTFVYVAITKQCFKFHLLFLR